MVDEFWFSRIESIVFDTIKKKSAPYLEQYSPILFVDTALSERPAQFPCIEITELQGVERGQTLTNDEICAYLSTFQINVYAEDSKQSARDIMSEIISHFKKDLAFNIVAMPVYAHNGDIHRYSARVRRLIGAGDTIVI